MARRFVAHCFALAALGLFAPALQAQDHLLDDLYGRGVHAYFSHRYPEANDLLSQAITSGSKDARAYYFRALAQNRLGRSAEAMADLMMGAQLEFGGEEPVKVGKALERVQGAERLMIEDARSKARLSIRNLAEERAKVRYENRLKAEAGVLRTPPGATPPPPAVGAPETLPTAPSGAKPPAAVPGAVPAAPPAKPAADDPFGDTPAKPAAPAEAKPAAPAEAKPAVPPAKPAAEDPFGDTPAKPAAPAEAKPATEKPGEVKPAAATAEVGPPAKPGSGTVLGSFMRAIKKAVPGEATVAASKAPAEETPPKVDPNAPDPFGDAPAKPGAPTAKPAAGKPAAAKPAAEDPFKDDAPAKAGAKKAAVEDPFK